MEAIKLNKVPVGAVIRQGDVILIRCKGNDVPKGATEVPRDSGRVILAYGEVTGHAHAFSDPGVCMLRAEGVSDRIITVTSDGALLMHEEHTAFVVPRGTYRVRIQREYDGEASLRVED